LTVRLVLRRSAQALYRYRAWLDDFGTPITVPQRAIRHGDIRVTMNEGDDVGEGLREASEKVAPGVMPQ